MIAELALRLAFARHPEHRWRLVATTLGTAVAAAVGVALAGGLHLVGRQDARERARLPHAAAAPGDRDVFWLITADRIGEQQYHVVYLEPAGTGTPVLPPGVAALPEPGQALLSPALARLAAADPVVAARFPHRAAARIEVAGLVDPGEWFAYVRPAAGRSIRDARRVLRVAGFGTGTPAAATTLGSPVSRLPATLGALAFLLLPAALIAVVGATSASPRRDARTQLLHALGCGPRRTGLLAATETAVLAVPGALVGALAARIGLSHARAVPLVDLAAAPGDLVPGPAAVLLAVAGSALVAVSAATLAAPRLSRLGEQPRPVSSRERLTRLRPAAIGAGVALCLLAAVARGEPGARLFAAGMVLVLVGLPLVMGEVVRRVGAAVGRLPGVPALLAGRRLEHAPSPSSRHLAGAMLLGFAVVTGEAWIRWSEFSLEQRRPAPVQHALIRVNATDLRYADRVVLGSVAGVRVVVPFGFHDVTGEVLLGTCADVSRLLAVPDPASGCRAPAVVPGRPATAGRPLPELLPPGGHRHLGVLGGATVRDPSAVPAGTRDRIRVQGFYVASDGSARTEAAVSAAAFARFPAPYVFSRESVVLRDSPVQRHVAAGMRVAAMLAVVAVALASVDAAFRRRRDDTALVAVGASRRVLAGVVAYESAAPLLLAIGVTLAAGAATASAFLSLVGLGPLRSDALVPLLAAGTGFAVAAALLAALVVVPLAASGNISND